MNESARKIKTGSKSGKRIRIIDENDRMNAYRFSKDFEFEVKDIMIAYGLATGDFNIDNANRYKLDELVKWYKSNQNMLDIIKLAAIFYHLFISVRPFVRNNQYMAQILMNTILSKQGFPPVVIPMEQRIEFLSSKDESCAAIVEELIREKIEGRAGPETEKIKSIDV